MFIEVKVKTSAGKSEIILQPDGSYKALLRAAREKGKANEELCKLVAKKFGVGAASVRLKSGQSASKKLIEIEV